MKTASLDVLEPRRLLATLAVNINPGVLHQEWEAWGGSASTWRNGGAYNDPEFFNALSDDLGMNGFRIPLWYPFEMNNDNDDPNVMNWDGFDISALNSTLKFAQELKKRGADTFLASVWSPPWFMKATSAHPYGGALRPDMREEYAEYLAAFVISAKRDFGIDIDVISIQNEAQFIEPYESTIYTPWQMIETMKVVGERFEREGLTTKLMAPEELSMFNRWKWWDNAFRADPEIWNSDMVWGTHYTPSGFYADLKRTSIDSGNPLWHTEAPGKGGGSWGSAIRLSEDIAGMMNFTNMSAFFEWQLDDPDPNSTVHSNGQKTRRWHAIKHYAKWIRPGARRTEMVTGNTDFDLNKQEDAFVTSWLDPARDAQAIVFTNFYHENITFNVQIQGSRTGTWTKFQSVDGSYLQPGSLPAGSTHNSFSITLPPHSMATLYDRSINPLPPQNLTSARGDVTIKYGHDIQFGHDVRRNSLQASEFWVKQQANSTNIHEEFVNGRDAIFAAAASPERQVIAVMNHLISLGARVNNPDNEGITPLMVAASTPMVWYTTQTEDPTLPSKKVGTLLDAGAKLHAKDHDGRTALHWAAMMPRWMYWEPYPQDGQVPKYLLQRGADKNKVDRFGMTPLMWAQHEGASANAAEIQAWTQDTAAPEVLNKSFDFDRRQAAIVDFDEAMGSFGSTQIGLWLLDGSGNLSTAINANVTRKTLPGTNTQAELVPTSRLPNGNFRVQVKSGQTIRDAAGNALAAGTVLNEFWFLNADANRDKRVDARDYGIFRKNFRKTNVGFTGGDFDYDGRVTMKDYKILRQNFGQSLAGAPSGPGGDPPLPGADPLRLSASPGVALTDSTSSVSGDLLATDPIASKGGMNILTGNFNAPGTSSFRTGGAINLLSDDAEDAVLKKNP